MHGGPQTPKAGGEQAQMVTEMGKDRDSSMWGVLMLMSAACSSEVTGNESTVSGVQTSSL